MRPKNSQKAIHSNFQKRCRQMKKKTAQMCELKISNSFLQSYIEMTWIEFKKHIEKISNYL